jgi:hypothetical protein
MCDIRVAVAWAPDYGDLPTLKICRTNLVLAAFGRPNVAKTESSAAAAAAAGGRGGGQQRHAEGCGHDATGYAHAQVQFDRYGLGFRAHMGPSSPCRPPPAGCSVRPVPWPEYQQAVVAAGLQPLLRLHGAGVLLPLKAPFSPSPLLRLPTHQSSSTRPPHPSSPHAPHVCLPPVQPRAPSPSFPSTTPCTAVRYTGPVRSYAAAPAARHPPVLSQHSCVWKYMLA